MTDLVRSSSSISSAGLLRCEGFIVTRKSGVVDGRNHSALQRVHFTRRLLRRSAVPFNFSPRYLRVPPRARRFNPLFSAISAPSTPSHSDRVGTESPHVLPTDYQPRRYAGRAGERASQRPDNLIDSPDGTSRPHRR